MVLQLCWNNAFWFFAVYGIVSWSVMRFMPQEIRKKVLTYAPVQGKEHISLMLSRIFRIISYIIALFSPVDIASTHFYIGSFVYTVGLILSTIALWQFSKADTSRPITDGLYRYSRHPMQVMFYLLCLGVLLASANLYLTIFTVGYIISFYPSFSGQEAYCREKYGTEYINYQNRTPKILFLRRKLKGDKL